VVKFVCFSTETLAIYEELLQQPPRAPIA
jgi:hypothetical protein